jgi:hypothetical protein
MRIQVSLPQTPLQAGGLSFVNKRLAEFNEIYLADDLSLDRKVASKFLPDVFTDDPERMARFER